MYCGCGTRPSRCTWCFSILFLLAAAIGLALGLYYTVPCTRTLVQCQRVRGNPITNGTRVLTESECWGNYWQCTSGAGGRAPGLFFWLAVAGAGCLLLSLLTCCCFCCQRSPAQKAAKKVSNCQRVPYASLEYNRIRLRGLYVQTTTCDTCQPTINAIRHTGYVSPVTSL